jgi:hypothetical protein
MRRPLWTVAILFVTIGARNAHADLITDYAINFTRTSGSDPAPTGTIVYDETSPAISAIIEWDGLTFRFPDLTAAGYGFLPGSSRPTICPGGVQAQIVFQFLNGCAGITPDWIGFVTQSGAGLSFFIAATDSTGEVILYSTSDFKPSVILPPPTEDFGILSIVPSSEPSIATPEPATSVLMLTSIVLAWAL